MKPHTRFRIKLVKELEKIPHTKVIVMQAGSVRGWPDLIICVNSFFFGAELKIPPDKPTEIQKLRIKQLKGAGGKVFVVTPLNYKKFLKDVKKFSKLFLKLN